MVDLSSLAPDFYGQFTPRYIGPVGNRVSAVAGIPGDHLTYYAGAASGGIFKTTDGGTHWASVFDAPASALDGRDPVAPVSSIGALAVSEANPNIVWAGTGESWIRGPISIGNGIYKSNDGGATWTHMGLEDAGRFGKIVTHPTDPDTAWAAALGSCYAPSETRGVFKTVDGGATWTRALHTNLHSGCCDLAIDPTNPAILYAGMWEFRLHSYIRVSGGPGSGVYKSIDGGETWAELTNGLPTGERTPDGSPRVVGKVSVGVAASDPDVVYASIETGDGVPTWDFPDPGNGQLFRSTDGGATWEVRNYNRWLNARPAYYTRNAVSPDNPNEVYFFSPMFTITTDGGETLTTLGFPEAPGVDHHEGWIDPTNGDRMIVAHDIGISITQNRGKSWYKISLPISQMYNVAVDQQVPYWVYGNCQDEVANWGPSNARVPYNGAQGDLDAGYIPRAAWVSGGNGECGYTFPDPKHPDLIWSSGASDGPNGGSVVVINRVTGHWRDATISPDFTTGSAPKDTEYRFHWHLPLAVSPNDNPDAPEAPRRVYGGSQHVHATVDFGKSWQVISPALTGYNAAYLRSSGGLTGDNLNVRTAFALSAIAESPCQYGLVWAGSNDQRLWLGRDTGDAFDWTELTGNIPGLPYTEDPDVPPWGYVSCILPSRYDAGTCYVSFDFHQAANSKPYVFKTSDFGQTWQPITDGIPHSVVSYVHWLAEDPVKPGLLFLGTENALYVSYDDGGRWQVLPGLPPAPVSGLQVQGHFHDLVISTFGRGFWIYDDITALRDLTELGDQRLYLFDFTRPIYRFQDIAQPSTIANDNDPTIGKNPPSPAPITFYLHAPADAVSMTISDAGGVVRSIQIDGSDTVAGLNRYWWDLQSDGSDTILLRTNLPDQKSIAYCPSGVRPYSDPIAGTSISYLAPPGDYTVQIAAAFGDDSATMERSLTILRDPTNRPDLSDAELQEVVGAQTDMLKAMISVLNQVVADVNTIEFLCFQIEQQLDWVESRAVADLLTPLEHDLRGIEDALIQRRITGQGEDLARFPAALVSNLAYVGGLVGLGDALPTAQQVAQFEKLQAALQQQSSHLQTLLPKITAEVNPALIDLGALPLLLDAPQDVQLCDLFDAGAAF